MLLQQVCRIAGERIVDTDITNYLLTLSNQIAPHLLSQVGAYTALKDDRPSPSIAVFCYPT